MALTPEERQRLAQLRAGAAPPREPEPKYGAIADVGRSLKAGVQSIPSATASFFDIPFGLAGVDRPVSRTFGALGEATGFQPKRWSEETSARNAASPELAKQRESQDTIWDRAGEDWAEGNRLKAAARVVGGTLINPRATTTMIAESIAPSLVMGGGASLLLKKAVPSLSPIAAGALGQAPVIGGYAMDGIDESVDPRRAAQAALGTTIAGTAIAGAGGVLAYRLGLIDPQTAIAGLGAGMVAKGTKPYGLGKRMAGGALSEGVLQELPQEAIDQIAINWAEDKPLFEGVPRAAYDGMIAGMGMGALFNVIRPSAVNAVDVTQPSEGAQTDAPEAISPAGTPPPTQSEINSYLKLAMFEQQLPETGAEAYRERAQEQMQRIEEQLVTGGLDPQALQLEVARKTYEDLQSKIAHAQQQGQEARATNLSRRAQQMENIFGRDVLRGPPLTVVDRLRSLDEQQAQSLFTGEGQLRSFASTEYERVQDMAPATRATYIMAQLEIARADAEQGAVQNRTLPLYQALADEYGLQLPERRVQSEQTPTDLAEGTPYAQSALGLADMNEQQRMAEVRSFVQRVDAQLKERAAQAQTQAQAEQIRLDTEAALREGREAFEPVPDTGLAAELTPIAGEVRRQQERTRWPQEFAEAQAQREAQETALRDQQIAEAYRQRELQDAAGVPAPVAPTEAMAEREAIQAEPQTEVAPATDNIPGFDDVPTQPAPEITGAVEAQVPGTRIIRKKDGGYFAPKYAQSRATFLNNKYGEQGFQYEAVRVGNTTDWEVQETRAAPVQAQAPAAPAPVQAQAPAAPATQEVVEEVQDQAPAQQEEIAAAPAPAPRGTTNYAQQAERAMDVLAGFEDGGRARFNRVLAPIMRAAYESNDAAAYEALNQIKEEAVYEFTEQLTEYVASKKTLSGTTESGGVSNLLLDMKDAGILDWNASKMRSLPTTGEYDYLKELANKESTERAAYNVEESNKKAQKKAERLLREGTEGETVRVKNSFNPDFDADGSYMLAEDGAEITKPLPVMRVKLAVRQFANKLHGAKPTFHVYASQADLKSRNPALYERAKAARARIADDFDTSPAVGYSFGDGQVLVFSDRVATEKQLKFMLAHETMGHFGLTGLFGKTELHNLLNKVWHESSPTSQLRAEVDRLMSIHKKMSRTEAIEEVLADMAATLETSILSRIWVALERALARLGVKIGSETARYMLSQARRYTRSTGIRLVMDADGHYTVVGPGAKGLTHPTLTYDKSGKAVVTDGWWMGDDGKWRFEISDKGAKLTTKLEIDKDFKLNSYNIGKAKKLGDVLNHPRLYAAYPDAANIRIAMVDDSILKGWGGLFYESNNFIAISDKPGALSKIMHEVQHWVQAKEDFQRGMSPDQAKAAVLGMTPDMLERAISVSKRILSREVAKYSMLRAKAMQINEYSEAITTLKSRVKRLRDNGNNQAFRQASKQLQDNLRRIHTEIFDGVLFAATSEAEQALWATFETTESGAEFDRVLQTYDGYVRASEMLFENFDQPNRQELLADFFASPDLAEHVYLASLGEAEARSTQMRLLWSDQQRRAQPFYEFMRSLTPEGDVLLHFLGQDIVPSRPAANTPRETATAIDLNEIGQRMQDMESGNDNYADGHYYRNTDTVSVINQTLGHDLYNIPRNMQTWLSDPIKNMGHWMTRAGNEIQTMNYTARDNRGYREFFKILASTVHTAFSLRTKYNDMMKTVLRPAFEIAGMVAGRGANNAQRKISNQMAIDATLYRFGHLTDPNVIRNNKDKIVRIDENGRAIQDQKVVDKMLKQSEITPEMFAKGFSYMKEEAQPLSPQLRAELELQLQTLDRKSKEYKQIASDLESGATMVQVKVDVPARPDITADSIEYRMYKEYQTTMAESAVDLLKANYAAAQGERKNVERIISEQIGRDLSESDVTFLKKYEDTYVAIREMGMQFEDDGSVSYDPDSLRKAEQFLVDVNKTILSTTPEYRERDFSDKVSKHLASLRKYIADPKNESGLRSADFDDAPFSSQIAEFATRDGGLKFKYENSKFIVQHQVANVALFELYKRDAELLAKRTIMGSYTPIGREGHWQVRIQATDLDGKELALSERFRSQLVYMQLNNESQGQRTVEEINRVYTDSSAGQKGIYEMEVYSNGARTVQPVRLVAKLEVAKQLPSIHSEVNLNEVLTTLTRFNIMLKPEERKAITIGLTAQNAKARTRIRREGTPGYNVEEVPKFVSQHLEAIASVISRRKHRHLMDQLMDDNNRESNDLWYGSQGEYNRLARQLETLSNDPNVDPRQVDAVKRRFAEYQHSFVTKNSQKTGNLFHDRAMRDLAFLESQADVEWTDFASGAAASGVRMATTFAQLGGSAATAALNIIALATNVIPFLSTYNQKNNFGGGFGPRAASELIRAGFIGKPGERAFAPYYKDLMEGYNFNDPTSTDKAHVAAAKRIEGAGLTPYETMFLYEQISSGVMQAALINAMLGSSRGRVTSGAAQKGAEAWMAMFSHSEQSARRMTGLAAYRLANERAIAEGKNFEEAHTEASKFAITAINDTLGEYGMFNRPSIFRGGVQQFIFMYKMFPLTSLLLFKNMHRNGKLLMLGTLMLLSGAKGLPLGDDLMDILDTIAQRTGLGPRGVWKGSAERTLQEFFAGVLPKEAVPFAMRGIVNNFMPINMSDRTSLGNVIPGTGLGLKGVETGREWMEVAGPIASFVVDTTKTGAGLAQWAAGTLPGTAQTIDLGTIARDSPVTMVRAFGDALAYHQNGAVTNNRGQVVSNEMHMGTIMGRLLGFYPAAAVREYDTIRTMTRVDGYQKAIVAEFRTRWIKARMASDQDAANRVVQGVRDWNDSARGTELEIRNFIPNSYRALQAAKLTATERYRKSSAVAQRQHIDNIAELFGASD